MAKVFVIIPAMNESKHIHSVVLKAKAYCRNIVVVDDGSTDNTSQQARKAGATVLRHVVNLGKGAALKTGCDYAVREGADILIAMDADGQHNPGQIPNFIKALEDVDAVLSYRSLNKNMPFVFRFGNWLIEFVTRLLYGVSIRDTQCGFRAFKREAYRKMRWQASDYSVESEMIALISLHKLSFRQIPIETIYHDKYKGTTVLDGLSIVLNMFWWRFAR